MFNRALKGRLAAVAFDALKFLTFRVLFGLNTLSAKNRNNMAERFGNVTRQARRY
jgi:hypothetical protein